jgi:hypothetical protein
MNYGRDQQSETIQIKLNEVVYIFPGVFSCRSILRLFSESLPAGMIITIAGVFPGKKNAGNYEQYPGLSISTSGIYNLSVF